MIEKDNGTADITAGHTFGPICGEVQRFLKPKGGDIAYRPDTQGTWYPRILTSGPKLPLHLTPASPLTLLWQRSLENRTASSPLETSGYSMWFK